MKASFLKADLQVMRLLWGALLLAGVKRKLPFNPYVVPGSGERRTCCCSALSFSVGQFISFRTSMST